LGNQSWSPSKSGPPGWRCKNIGTAQPSLARRAAARNSSLVTGKDTETPFALRKAKSARRLRPEMSCSCSPPVSVSSGGITVPGAIAGKLALSSSAGSASRLRLVRSSKCKTFREWVMASIGAALLPSFHGRNPCTLNTSAERSSTSTDRSSSIGTPRRHHERSRKYRLEHAI
jgi:hypothetical protein